MQDAVLGINQKDPQGWKEGDYDCNQTFPRIVQILSQALNVEEPDIKLDSRLIGDLGAESIDFLDLSFRLEREFNIKIQTDELFPADVFDGDPECVQAGRVTAHGLAKLKAAAPHVDFVSDDGEPTFDGTVEGITDAFTVMCLIKYIHIKTS